MGHVPSDHFTVRAPFRPVDRMQELLDAFEPNGAGPMAAVLRGVRRVAAEPHVLEAVRVASPGLHAGLTALLRDADGSGTAGFGPAQLRTAGALLRYVIRMHTRPTPYGLFAGVAVGRFGDGPVLRAPAGLHPRRRTRTDTAWLLALTRRIAADPDVLPNLPVRLNALVERVGQRLVLPYADVHGRADDRHVDLTVSEPVGVVLETLGTGSSRFADLEAELDRHFPTALPGQANAMLRQLLELHVLVDGLRPLPSTPYPERALLERLRETPGTADWCARLDELVGTLEGSDADPGVGDRARGDAERLQRELVPDHRESTLQVDAALDGLEGDLPPEIGRAAAEAADVLDRLAGARRRPTHLVAYHEAFVERYGVHAEIPVLEVLSAEHGLDAPSTYTLPPRGRPDPHYQRPEPSPLDSMLRERALEALRRGEPMELTDAFLDDVPYSGELDPRPSVDVCAQIAAASPEHLADGRWTMILNSSSLAPGGRMLGRFHDLLPGTAADRLREVRRWEAEREPGCDVATVAFVVPHGRAGNVTAQPVPDGYEIAVNCEPGVEPDRRLTLGEVLVGATDDRLYLRSAATGRELRVVQGHMLSTLLAPNVARLLLEISEDRFRPALHFYWGELEDWPALPRVVRGRTVFAPATWRLANRVRDDDVPFAESVRRWRAVWGVPRHVVVAAEDNRLLVDLDSTVGLDQLESALTSDPAGADGSGRTTVQEALPRPDELWLAGRDRERYFCEIVTTVRNTDAPAVRSGIGPVPRSTASTPAVARRELVGGPWLHLKLYAATDTHDVLIAGPLSELIDGLRADGHVERWFYVRYHDPSPHLRIRIRSADPGAVREIVTGWAAQLVHTGLAADLALCSYDREVERYGGPATVDRIEELFTAGSDASRELVRYRRSVGDDLPLDVLGATSLSAFYAGWGAGSDLVPDHRTLSIDDRTRRRFSQVRSLLCDLVEPWAEHPDDRARRHLASVDAALATQRGALRSCGDRVRELAAAGELSGSEARVLAAATHLSMNRLAGMSRDVERGCFELMALAHRAVGGRPHNRDRERR